jgi:hypothetical protein
MKEEKAIDVVAITSHLIANAEKLRYGTASVSLKIHEGTIVAVSHETTEITKEKEAIK